jgi:hypothetical protein
MGIPFETLADVRAIWEQQRQRRIAALIAGCARLPERGLIAKGASNTIIDLAAV